MKHTRTILPPQIPEPVIRYVSLKPRAEVEHEAERARQHRDQRDASILLGVAVAFFLLCVGISVAMLYTAPSRAPRSAQGTERGR